MMRIGYTPRQLIQLGAANRTEGGGGGVCVRGTAGVCGMTGWSLEGGEAR